MTLRDPKTGRFIKNRAKKHLEISYGISLLKTTIYAICFFAFLGMLAATVLFLQVETMKRDLKSYTSTAAAERFDSTTECFPLEELSTEVIGVLDSNELVGGTIEPETEKPRPAIRVFRNGRESLE